MKTSKTNKSIVLLIVFVILAGGSFSTEDFWLILVTLILLGIFFGIAHIFGNLSDEAEKEKKESQRNIIERNFPEGVKLYERSDSYIYLNDKSKQVFLIQFESNSSHNIIINNIQPTICEITSNYYFITDDSQEKIYILEYENPNFIEYVFNYEDIISIQIIENNITTYSKSATRVIGGAIIGGALAGGAGLITGGLSGKSKEKKNITKFEIKLLIRDSASPSLVLTLYNILDKKKRKIENLEYVDKPKAEKIKDVITVIIDKIDRRHNQL